MKKHTMIIMIALLVAVSACTVDKKPAITNFEECIAAGNPVMESYPRQCSDGDNTFTEDIGQELDMGDCKVYFDGCNTCRVMENDEVACTRMFCEEYDEPRCLDEEVEYITCTEDQKAAEICTMDYTPVCGDDEVTYGNACMGCASGNIDTYVMGECASQESEETTQLANPASVYCVEQKGVLDIIDTETGQVGYCELPDGRICEEWALFNSEGKECVELEE